jgi:hypothetical protein
MGEIIEVLVDLGFDLIAAVVDVARALRDRG